MFIVLSILGILACFIALIFIVALFSKKKYHVQRQVVINKPVSEVYDYLKHLRNQDNFSVWVMKDPGMNRYFTGNDGHVGFIYAWDSVNKQAGKGEQEIKGLIENEKINLEVRFEKPMKAVAQTPFHLESLVDNQTRVTWKMDSAMNYPMNIMLLFLNFDKMLGKDMETSLNNVKRILEK